jgi:hypothetical protein
MKRSFGILALTLMVSLIGCHSESGDWSARVLAEAENPNNGQYNFGSQRAEVIADRCGLLHPSCASVRLLDETGFANAQGGRFFTYTGDSQAISIRWIDPKTLEVRCQGCEAKKIQRKQTQVNFTHIEYKL